MSMKQKMMSLTMLALLILSAGASAEPGKAVSLDDCLAIAMTNALPMTNARLDQNILRMKANKGRSEAFPKISARGDYTRIDVAPVFDTPDGPVELAALDNYSASLNVSQLLFSGGRVGAAIRASRLTTEYSIHNLSETRSALIRDISIDFFAVLLARTAADVQRESEEQLKLFAEHVKAKHESGAVSELDWLAADLRYRNVIPARIAAENAEQLASNALHQRIGLDIDAGYVFTGAVVPASMPMTEELAREMSTTNRPAIARMSTTVALLEQGVIAARSPLLPSVSISASLSHANSDGFASSDNWESHWNAGAAIEWSLFDGGLTRADVRQKRFELERQIAEFEDFKRVIRLQIRQAFLAYEQSSKAITAAESAVAIAQKTLALAGVRYDLGLATGLDVAEANVATKQARLALAVAVYEQNVAVAALEHAAGITASTFGPERGK